MAAMNLSRLRPLFMLRNFVSGHTKLHTSKIHFADDATAKPSLYEILKISSSASQTEIKQAYYDLTLKYHPDRNENSEVAAKKFREVTEAYEVLGNYGLRKKYDRGIPLTIVKETVKRTPVAHKVQYQEFFEHRTAQSTSFTQKEEFDKYARKPKKEYDFYEDFDAETRDNKNAVQLIVAVYLTSLIVYANWKNRE